MGVGKIYSSILMTLKTHFLCVCVYGEKEREREHTGASVGYGGKVAMQYLRHTYSTN
jgi:hypothetical protein